MRHRQSQSLATSGAIAGSPMSLATRGVLQPRNRFKVERVEKRGVAGAIDYTYTFSTTIDSANAEIVKGEYVDDLAVLSGTHIT